MTIHTSDPERYQAVRDGVGSVLLERGVLRLTGADRLDLLHRLSTADLNRLRPGGEGTTILTTEKGRIIDQLRVVVADDHLLIVTQGPSEPVAAWLEKYTIMDDVVTTMVDSEYSVIGIYGDRVKGVVASTMNIDVPESGSAAIAERGEIVLREPGINGPGGVLVIVPSDAAASLSERLRDANVVPLDTGTYQVMRIEAGQPAYGAELSDDANPLEVGLSSFISFTKGCYIGQEVIARLDSYDKVKQHLMGIRIADGLPADGIGDGELVVRDIISYDVIGRVTSLATSPAIGDIGLGIIRTAHANPDVSIVLTRVGEDTQLASGRLSLLPFA